MHRKSKYVHIRHHNQLSRYRREQSFEKRVQQLSEEMEEQMERDRQRIFEKEGDCIFVYDQ